MALLLNHPSIWNFTWEHCNWWFWTSNSPAASHKCWDLRHALLYFMGAKDWTQGFKYARWAFYHLWVTAQPTPQFLKIQRSQGTGIRGRGKVFRTFVKRWSRWRFWLLLAEDRASGHTMCAHADPAPPWWEEARASEQLPMFQNGTNQSRAC